MFTLSPKLLEKLDPYNMDFLGPMEIKELWQGLRRGMFVWPFICIHILAILATIAELVTRHRVPYDEFSGFLNVFHIFTSGPFWLVIGVICGILMPLGGLILMSPEMEDGNHELLQMTHLSRWSVVRGKWFGLWGLCLLTLSSMLPYLIVRYFQGGMDIGRNIALLSTTVGLSAILSAIAIGASAYKTVGGRLIILIIMSASLVFSSAPAMSFAAMRTNSCGLFYHFNALSAAFCFTALGLSLARSRIRLKVHQYEVKPSSVVTGLILFTPFVAGITTAMTVGYLGGLALIFIGIVSMKSDTTPKSTGQLPGVMADGDKWASDSSS